MASGGRFPGLTATAKSSSINYGARSSVGREGGNPQRSVEVAGSSPAVLPYAGDGETGKHSGTKTAEAALQWYPTHGLVFGCADLSWFESRSLAVFSQRG